MFLNKPAAIVRSVAGLRAVRGLSVVTRDHKLIDVLPQVQESLLQKEPVVALESTIITHGMPYPQNMETAKEVEQLVRSHGATPATIAIVNGRIKVGLTEADLNNLAAMPRNNVIKCSRCDLPYVVAKRLNGGTTVAATMIIAHMVGLQIFATGGIGGVHREGQNSLDISADLIELGRTPVTVVCSGVKSILDIPRTLEYLETQGVCIATYGDAEGRFPDFYTRDSGYRVPYNVQGPAEAAHFIKALHDLELKSGTLIAVPVPEAYEADKSSIQAAIDQASLQAKQQGITGKEITPFLLSAIAEITKGNSLQANIALIKNNATVAAQIAREMYAPRTTSIATGQCTVPLVIGASILDLSLTMQDDLPEKLNGATYNIHAKQSAGGVGRNLAEAILKLFGDVHLISVVGADQLGKSLLKLIPTPLQRSMQIDKTNATSLCSIIFDKTGDCKLTVGNMEIHQSITPQYIREKEHLLRNAPLVIIDGNLAPTTIECILELALQYKRPVFFEPTDMRIAGKPFQLSRTLYEQIKIISPNIYELTTIVETLTDTPVQTDINPTESTAIVLQKTKDLILQIKNHFDCIIVTLGQHGVLLSVRGDMNSPLFDAKNGDYLTPVAKSTNDYTIRYYAAPRVKRVTNVSGAGDSFSSGFITGLLRGYNIERCVAMGFIAAGRALQSHSAVPDHYFQSESEELSQLSSALGSLDKRNI